MGSDQKVPIMHAETTGLGRSGEDERPCVTGRIHAFAYR